jgi:hypothetical protein
VSAGSSAGRLVALYTAARAQLLRVMGLASRRDILATQKRIDKLLREHLRAAEKVTRKRKSRDRGLSERLSRLETQLGSQTRGMDGRLRHVARNVQSLVRHEYLDQTALPFPQNVLSQRFHERSQNEEDGITLALIKLVGETNRRFVEIGAGTNGGNSGFLAENCGWTGLMVDGSPERAKRLVARFGRPGVRARGAWITVDNINQLVIDSDMSGEIDLLSLDIDGNDFWVWRELNACSPRMVILEFNGAFGPERTVTVPYDAAFDRASFRTVTQHYYGASLAAFEWLGRTKGYRLILVEPRGINAYFLRDDVGPDIPAVSAAAVHPDPTKDAQPLFTRIADAKLPLVDLDSPGEPEASAPVSTGDGPR